MAAALLALVLLLAGDSGSAADDRSVEDRRTELGSLKKEIEQKRALITKLRGEGKDVERLLAEIERERGMTERYLQRLAEQERGLEEDVSRHRGDLQLNETQRDGLRQELSRALVSYYKEHRVGAAELLVSSTTFGELFAREHYWVRMIRQIQERLGMLAQVGSEVRQNLKGIEQRRSELTGLREEREAQLRHLQEQAGERRRHREQLDRTVADYEEQTRRLVASQAQIERMIEEAMRAPQGASGKGLAAQRGRISWPVEGTVVSRFGTQIHPRYGTKVENKGIEIAAAEGTPVHAVASGRVVFQGWLGGYGLTVVLDHGEGFFTLYAHASDTPVTRGDSVAAGQVIAHVGSMDAVQGAALYFEIRQQARALDPLQWLAGRGR